jgi:crossover junction endodeoxyribonuclease RusA
MMLPFEFTVPGPPVSHQSRNKARLDAWRRLVRSQAAKLWGSAAPLKQELKLDVRYYHEGEAVRIDNDNMVKPIQDALIGLIYVDDRLIIDTIVRKMSIDGTFRVKRHKSREFIIALAKGDEFLHIKVTEASSQREPRA